MFYGSFWRWQLYNSGSLTSVQPNKDLAHYYLLVFQCTTCSRCVCENVAITRAPSNCGAAFSDKIGTGTQQINARNLFIFSLETEATLSMFFLCDSMPKQNSNVKCFSSIGRMSVIPKSYWKKIREEKCVTCIVYWWKTNSFWFSPRQKKTPHAQTVSHLSENFMQYFLDHSFAELLMMTERCKCLLIFH